MSLVWAAPPPSRYGAGRWMDAEDDRPDLDGHWIELVPDVEQWRWDDLEADMALTLDFTDGGFSWTPAELLEVVKLGQLARGMGMVVDDLSLRKMERALSLGRADA